MKTHVSFRCLASDLADRLQGIPIESLTVCGDDPELCYDRFGVPVGGIPSKWVTVEYDVEEPIQ